MSTEAAELGPLVSDRTAWEVTRPLVHSAIAFIVLDTLIVLAKTYSRMRIAKLRFWWDDFWIVVAYALLMPICGLGIAMVEIEVAWSREDRIILDLDENEVLLKIIYALLQFLLASYAATRYSILALYLRMFSDKMLRRAIWAVVAFVTLQWLGYAFTSVFQCSPVQHYWNRRIEGSCVDVDRFYRSFTPTNLVVDVVLIFMPLPTVWKLRATNARKWALTLLFFIGTAALIASAIRLSIYDSHTAKYIAPSYTNIMVMWLVIEPSIYLIAACLPAMHHIIAAAFPQRLLERFDRLRRLPSEVLSRSRTRKTGNMSLTSVTDDNDLSLELGDGPRGVKSSAHAASSGPCRGDRGGAGGGSRHMHDGVDSGMLNKGIVVTNEVTVTYTQEERIERIIGF